MRQRGFTLLELMISIAVFAVMAAMAYGGLASVLSNRKHLEAQADALNQVQTAFTFLERDIEQAVGRPVKDSFGAQQAAFSAQPFGTMAMELSRAGNRVVTEGRSTLLRVGYRLKENEGSELKTLTRIHWLALDQGVDTEPVERLLLDNVKEMEVRVLDHSLEWKSSWPDSSALEPPIDMLPRGVEVTLDVDGFGKLKRIFRVSPGEYISRKTPAHKRGSQPPAPAPSPSGFGGAFGGT